MTKIKNLINNKEYLSFRIVQEWCCDIDIALYKNDDNENYWIKISDNDISDPFEATADLTKEQVHFLFKELLKFLDTTQ